MVVPVGDFGESGCEEDGAFIVEEGGESKCESESTHSAVASMTFFSSRFFALFSRFKEMLLCNCRFSCCSFGASGNSCALNAFSESDFESSVCSSPFFSPRKCVGETSFDAERSSFRGLVVKVFPSLNCIASSNEISGTKCSNRINSFMGSLAQFGNTNSSQMSETNLLDNKCETFFAIYS